ncbi:hypothetical protein CGRA01v4_10863 [Colletotrichum graminicola]|nr:hypothetical protein CGRA01v4_10863 [Colletotrichum graminicola]
MASTQCNGGFWSFRDSRGLRPVCTCGWAWHGSSGDDHDPPGRPRSGTGGYATLHHTNPWLAVESEPVPPWSKDTDASLAESAGAANQSRHRRRHRRSYASDTLSSADGTPSGANLFTLPTSSSGHQTVMLAVPAACSSLVGRMRARAERHKQSAIRFGTARKAMYPILAHHTVSHVSSHCKIHSVPGEEYGVPDTYSLFTTMYSMYVVVYGRKHSQSNSTIKQASKGTLCLDTPLVDSPPPDTCSSLSEPAQTRLTPVQSPSASHGITLDSEARSTFPPVFDLSFRSNIVVFDLSVDTSQLHRGPVRHCLTKTRKSRHPALPRVLASVPTYIYRYTNTLLLYQ